MWDLPGPGLEPVSPALAGGFLSTVPPGKPKPAFSYKSLLSLAAAQELYFSYTTLSQLRINSTCCPFRILFCPPLVRSSSYPSP